VYGERVALAGSGVNPIPVKILENSVGRT